MTSVHASETELPACHEVLARWRRPRTRQTDSAPKARAMWSIRSVVHRCGPVRWRLVASLPR